MQTRVLPFSSLTFFFKQCPTDLGLMVKFFNLHIDFCVNDCQNLNFRRVELTPNTTANNCVLSILAINKNVVDLIVSRNSQIDVYSVRLLYVSVNHFGDSHRHFKYLWDLKDKLLEKLAT